MCLSRQGRHILMDFNALRRRVHALSGIQNDSGLRQGLKAAAGAQ
jgi:hypothetical protein